MLNTIYSIRAWNVMQVYIFGLPSCHSSAIVHIINAMKVVLCYKYKGSLMATKTLLLRSLVYNSTKNVVSIDAWMYSFQLLNVKSLKSYWMHKKGLYDCNIKLDFAMVMHVIFSGCFLTRIKLALYLFFQQ